MEGVKYEVMAGNIASLQQEMLMKINIRDVSDVVRAEIRGYEESLS